MYVDEPVTSPHRQFCQELVTRLCRLSFWERVAAVLPAKFRTLLGPPPSTPTLPGTVRVHLFQFYGVPVCTN